MATVAGGPAAVSVTLIGCPAIATVNEWLALAPIVRFPENLSVVSLALLGNVRMPSGGVLLLVLLVQAAVNAATSAKHAMRVW